ncbi:acyl-CoA thioesterase [Candidatus Laterigemmans baculatus]|uniref:acyl-CoA thioesterase n=1 Tax=Candidatus Laterigemmans baculatus TaxID=2770505 RepID=UPI0013DD39A5|nr:thioesterase family protein [Candidatus Laterigemmans baculatus]
MHRSHRLTIRVTYSETDGQRRVHHANYLNYFERGRVELLRSLGQSYKTFEDEGLMLVVSEMNVRYFQPAEFDDLLELETAVESARGARIRHSYRITRGEELIVTAQSTIACVGSDGRVKRLPASLQAG